MTNHHHHNQPHDHQHPAGGRGRRSGGPQPFAGATGPVGPQASGPRFGFGPGVDRPPDVGFGPGRDRPAGPGSGPDGFGPDGFGPAGFGFGPAGDRPGPGPGPWAGPEDGGPAGFGFGGGRGRFGPGPGGRGGRGRPGHGGPGGRRRRGDVRLLLLAALLDGDAHGYELIRRLEERTAGAWRPSAGSVYPTLQLLEEEELITGRDEGGKRIFALTDTGRAEAERSRDGGAWEDLGAGSAQHDLRGHIGQLALAAKQVSIAGDTEQVDKAVGILRDARQALYRLLAGD